MSPSARAPARTPPLPLLRTLVAAVGLFCNSFNSAVILPFISFMVSDFGVAPTPADVGAYAGCLVASFMLGQLVSSYFWGALADSHGRKPVIVAGLASSASAFLAFGFASSYSSALAWRFISGLLNGVVGVTKTYVSEITDESTQAQGFAILGVTRALGMIAGPVIGGFLSSPSDKMPHLFPKGSLFHRHPYAMPCIVGSSIAIAGAVAAWIVLEETLKRPIRKLAPPSAKPLSISSSSIDHQHNQSPLAIAKSFIQKLYLRLLPRTPSPAASFPKLSTSSNLAGPPPQYSPCDQRDVEAAYSESTPLLSRCPSSASTATLPSSDRLTKVSVDRSATPTLENAVASASSSATMSPAFSPPARRTAAPKLSGPPSIISILCDTKVSLSVFFYSMVSCIFIQYDELFALWSRLTPDEGGLDFTSSDQGVSFMTGGVFLLVYQLFFFAYIERTFGCLLAFRSGLALTLPAFIILPSIGIIYNLFKDGNISTTLNPVLLTPKQHPLVWSLVISCQFMRTVGGLQAFTTTFIMISNSVQSQSRGSLNGAAQTLGSLGRMIGPIFAGTLFSWSLKNKLGAPFDFRFPFFILFILTLGTLSLSYLMPESINRRIPEKDDDEEVDIDDDVVSDIDACAGLAADAAGSGTALVAATFSSSSSSSTCSCIGTKNPGDATGRDTSTDTCNRINSATYATFGKIITDTGIMDTTAMGTSTSTNTNPGAITNIASRRSSRNGDSSITPSVSISDIHHRHHMHGHYIGVPIVNTSVSSSGVVVNGAATAVSSVVDGSNMSFGVYPSLGYGRLSDREYDRDHVHQF